MTCGFDEALSRIVIVPDFGPRVCGEKVTLMAQFAAGATDDPQVVELMANWPFDVIEEIVSVVLPVLVSLTVCGVLVVPTVCL